MKGIIYIFFILILSFAVFSSDLPHVEITAVSNILSENQFYAEGYYHNESNPIQINLISVDTLYNITGFIMGDTYGFSFSDNGVDVDNSGLYQLSGTISFYGGNSGEYDFYLVVDGIEQEDCAIERSSSSTSIGNVGMTCLKQLSSGEHINIQVEDHSIPVQDIYITSMNLNIVEINKTTFLNVNITQGGSGDGNITGDGLSGHVALWGNSSYLNYSNLNWTGSVLQVGGDVDTDQTGTGNSYITYDGTNIDFITGGFTVAEIDTGLFYSYLKMSLSRGLVINSLSGGSSNDDLQVNTDTIIGALFVDASDDRVKTFAPVTMYDDVLVDANLNATSGNDICITGGNCLSDKDNITGDGLLYHVPYWTNETNLDYDNQDFYYNPTDTTGGMGLGYITTIYGRLSVMSQSDSDNTVLMAYNQPTYFYKYIASSSYLQTRSYTNAPFYMDSYADNDRVFYQEVGIQGYDAQDNMGLMTGGIGQGQACIPSALPYTVKDIDHTLYCCTKEANLQVNLPVLRDQNFRELEFKILEDSCQITIDPFVTDTIEGGSTYILSGLYNAVEIHAFDDRTYLGWYITGAYGLG